SIMLVTIIAFIVILSVLVIVHELGHFLVAKKLGIKVEEFGFGFPPRLFGKKIGETIYSINLLPVGGFVKLFGEDAAGGGSVKAKSNLESRISNNQIKRAFFARPVWQRFTVVIAGVVMNFLLAVVLISYLFGTQGVAIPGQKIHITEILKDSPAAAAGLKVGDTILSLNGKNITSTTLFIQAVKQDEGKEVTLGILRSGKNSDIKLIPRTVYPKDQGPVGVGISDVVIKKYTWYEAPFFGTIEALKFSWMIVAGLVGMAFNLIVHGQKPTGVAGPVGVAQLTGQAVSYGVNATLWFVALLSINLAVLNVLPIPALDGGRLFFIVVEAVTRKKVNVKYENYTHAVGLVVLLALMLLITVFDVMRLVSGQSLLPK
ncbi:MAG: RIP metalloprotease RseP, partial [Candidatus Levyibacteriota bacterium]